MHTYTHTHIATAVCQNGCTEEDAGIQSDSRGTNNFAKRPNACHRHCFGGFLFTHIYTLCMIYIYMYVYIYMCLYMYVVSVYMCVCMCRVYVYIREYFTCMIVRNREMRAAASHLRFVFCTDICRYIYVCFPT